ncbi:MAG: galactokinase family protein [Oscillospiraceae bacterium]|nr:galactokinase family protein [Oscillospiraceae bacterium]MDD6146893.1 galactokinase family protein [Oscillospiraceae bacterium]
MANVQEMRKLLESKSLSESFSKVYTEESLALQHQRYLEVLDSFTEVFGDDAQAEVSLFSAPGRTEICGNHTDHNHGLVLAGGISLDAIAVAAKRDDGIIRIKSAGYPMDEVDCSDLEIKENEKGRSQSIIRGIVARFTQLGYQVGGFDAATASQVLSGSGLSSSAAFEILVCTMLNHLYNGGRLDPVELAKISQYSENVYFGKPCGLMDQTACSVGGFVKIDFNDTAKPVVEKIDFDFGKSGYSLCIVDTKGSHSDLTDEYAAVRSEMEAVASFFGKEVLRQTDKKAVLENAGALAEKFGERAVLRALHFFGENEKVEAQAKALESGDFDAFKALVIASGRSSYMYNQNVFSCKKPTSQPLSLALAVSEQILSDKGAWRVHGGGFAGTIQAFVPNESVEEYTGAMKSIFGDDSCYVLSIRPFGGVKIY